MLEINNVVAGVLACIENEAVKREIDKQYVLKIEKLKFYDNYLSSDEFKSKSVNDINFQNCIKYAVSRLSDEKFRLFLQKANICVVVFYKKETHNLNTKTTSIPKSLDFLRGIMVKYYLEDSKLFICINPVYSFKEQVLAKKSDIIKYFNDNNKPINDVIVKFMYQGRILDDFEESLLSIGYNLQQKK